MLDVKIRDYPTHAASLPVAMIPNCAATRHVHFTLDGSGPARLEPPSLEDWPSLTYDFSKGRRVFLDSLTRAEVGTWKPGEVLLLNGRILTGRDAAHKRMVDMLARGREAARGLHQPASSTTSDRSIRCATRSSVPPVPRPPRAWTSSPAPCWRRPGWSG